MHMQVLNTSNYNQFKSLTGNRNINTLHLARLMESMTEEHLLSPIIVNEDGSVIDGQHRLEASKRLGLPVNYIVCEGYGLNQIHRFNQNSKDWRQIDFVQGYAELGNGDYIYLLDFHEHTGLSITTCITLLSNSGSSSNDIRNGIWKAKHKQRATTITTWLDVLKPYYKGVERKSFVLALISMYKREEFNFAHFVSKVAIQPTALVDCPKTDDYKILIESIYNYKNRNKVNLRF